MAKSNPAVNKRVPNDMNYETPENNPFRPFPFIVSDIGLKAHELGIFTFLYYRANDKTYRQARSGADELGKIAFWSYTKLSKNLDISRVKISQTVQLFENTGLIKFVSRPSERKAIDDQILSISKKGQHRKIETNIYAMFAAPRMDHANILADIVAEERVKLERLYLPDGRLIANLTDKDRIKFAKVINKDIHNERTK